MSLRHGIRISKKPWSTCRTYANVCFYEMSLISAGGAHPKYIQAQLGHACIQVTMDMYGTLFPGTFSRLVDALDDPTGCNPGATIPELTEQIG